MGSMTEEIFYKIKDDIHDIEKITFTPQQAYILDKFSKDIAKIGGIQVQGADIKAGEAALKISQSFDGIQKNSIHQYVSGMMSALIFEGLIDFDNESPPNILPSIENLEKNISILYAGARNQILLYIVEHRAFAYDIDNHGKLLRLVGNFKGGGERKIQGEIEKVETSSHSGLALGPHTEAPYHCAVKPTEKHSPSPSALILSAIWNPGEEPTSIIPLSNILDKIGVSNILCLTTKNFNFTRSDPFNEGQGEDGIGVSILDFDQNHGFSVRFNSYRFTVNHTAPSVVKKAFDTFMQAIAEAKPFTYSLSQNSAIIINNARALHCRDIIKDNRRLLVRIFGYSKFSEAIVLSESPLIVRG